MVTRTVMTRVTSIAAPYSASLGSRTNGFGQSQP